MALTGTQQILTRDIIARNAVRLRAGEIDDYDPLIEFIGNSRFVLLGEASHGTHEFYHERAQITKRLIREKGFTAVAVEADFPDAHRVDQFVRGAGTDVDAVDALSGFKRFPAWMWRNADVLDFVGWLRSYNEDLLPDREAVGFYGLDLYSLHTSIEAVLETPSQLKRHVQRHLQTRQNVMKAQRMDAILKEMSIEAVLEYLEKADPDAAARARQRYACFDHFGTDTQAYGYAAGLGIAESCEKEVVDQLTELYRQAHELISRDGRVASDAY